VNPASKQQLDEPVDSFEDNGLDQLYNEADYWHVNIGESKIHAKRMPGRFRRLKWMTACLYLIYFLGPYLRWGGRQAILIDIPNRKTYIFGLTFWPQDYWMLSLVLLILAIGLFFTTTIVGRAFCGYFCWQTVWVDIFTWIEEKLEGSPSARIALDAAPWSMRKIRIKTLKHLIFLFLAALTGVTFTSYFIDVGQLWTHYTALEGHAYIWSVPLIFMIGCYCGVALLREQLCFWLCPYARIQGVMIDPQTIMPTYDFKRGEQRARIGKGDDKSGDCIDCNLCVAVCPTGVDIRSGQQEGCITCGLCIDACDAVMEKVNRPTRLISYRSLPGRHGEASSLWYKRGRVYVYSLIMLASLGGIVYGTTQMGGISLTVIHERQPLFARLSDGSIQNRYLLKMVNKEKKELLLTVAISGVDGVRLEKSERLIIPAGAVRSYTLFVKASEDSLVAGNTPLRFTVTGQGFSTDYKSVFVAPLE